MLFPATIREIAIYNASHCTTELAPALLATIKAQHHHPEKITHVTSYHCDRDDILYIIVCPAGLKIGTRYPKYYIFWQLEYMPLKLADPYYLGGMFGALQIWDYSRHNIKLTQQQYPDLPIIYVPVGYNDSCSTPEIISGKHHYTKDIPNVDILFLGYVTPGSRRKIFIDNCVAAGLKVEVRWDLDVDGMKQILRRAKICVNMASAYPFVLATVRLNMLLSNQACIVSEIPEDLDILQEYQESGIVFCPYDDLVANLVALIKDDRTPSKQTADERRKVIVQQSYDWYRTQRCWTDLVNFNELLPTLE